jgi:Rrf2 family protein
MLTNAAKYGLKAMAYLAERQDQSPIKISEIAFSQNIPEKFLVNIFIELKNHGYIFVFRGRKGGYALAKKPSDIQVGEIIRAIDGTLSPISCASKKHYKKCLDCKSEINCPVRIIMARSREALSSVLDKCDLEQFCRLGEAGI